MVQGRRQRAGKRGYHRSRALAGGGGGAGRYGRSSPLRALFPPDDGGWGLLFLAVCGIYFAERKGVRRGGKGELEDAVDPLPCVRRLRLTMGIGVCFFRLAVCCFLCWGLLFFSGLLIFHGWKKGDAFRCVPNSCRTHLGSSLRWREGAYRGISLIRNSPPPGTTIGP